MAGRRRPSLSSIGDLRGYGATAPHRQRSMCHPALVTSGTMRAMSLGSSCAGKPKEQCWELGESDFPAVLHVPVFVNFHELDASSGKDIELQIAPARLPLDEDTAAGDGGNIRGTYLIPVTFPQHFLGDAKRRSSHRQAPISVPVFR